MKQNNERLLSELRNEVDNLDGKLVKMLNDRTEFAIKIANVKKEMGLPIYTPERERDIMIKISNMNKGPLSDESLQRIYERLLDESRATQNKASINSQTK